MLRIYSCSVGESEKLESAVVQEFGCGVDSNPEDRTKYPLASNKKQCYSVGTRVLLTQLLLVGYDALNKNYAWFPRMSKIFLGVCNYFYSRDKWINCLLCLDFSQ